jgi:hypothetical protein
MARKYQQLDRWWSLEMFNTFQALSAVARKKVSGSVGTAPTYTDCVAYWKLEDNAASTTVVDSVGSFNGTSSPNTADMSATGKINNGFLLDGTNDFFSSTSPLSAGTNVYTISVWFSLDNNTLTSNDLFSIGTADQDVFLVRLNYITEGTNNFLIRENGGSYNTLAWTGTNYYNTGWHHMVIVSNGTNIKVYVDNAQVGSTMTTSDGVPTNTGFFLGKQVFNGGSDRWFGGDIDEFSFFDVALTDDNRTYLYQGGTPGTAQQYPFLNTDFTASNTGFWTLRTSLAAGIVDQSPSGNDFVNSGATWETTPNAIRTDGVTDLLTNTYIIPTGTKTVSIWVNTTDIGFATILQSGGPLGGTDNGFALVLDSAEDAYATWGSGSSPTSAWAVCDGTTNIDTGAWVHLVAVQDGTTSCTLYVNGVSDATDTVFAGSETLGADLTIGASSHPTSREIAADFNSLGVWTTSFTADQVIELYNKGREFDPYA